METELRYAQHCHEHHVNHEIVFKYIETRLIHVCVAFFTSFFLSNSKINRIVDITDNKTITSKKRKQQTRLQENNIIHEKKKKKNEEKQNKRERKKFKSMQEQQKFLVSNRSYDNVIY